jgi:hypothetical protein
VRSLTVRQENAASFIIRNAPVSPRNGSARSRSAVPIKHQHFSEDIASASGTKDTATVKSAHKEWLAAGIRDLAAAT